MNPKNKSLEDILDSLEVRFNRNTSLHPNTKWEHVAELITSEPSIASLIEYMESSGGEPDVVEMEGSLYLVDTTLESPKGRRSFCYDALARKTRKKFPPENDAVSIAESYDASLMDETMYRYLQSFSKLDTKTSSWILTPGKIRELGGALFGDNRYDTVFIYHNGADSYYGSRGFRMMKKLKG